MGALVCPNALGLFEEKALPLPKGDDVAPWEPEDWPNAEKGDGLSEAAAPELNEANGEAAGLSPPELAKGDCAVPDCPEEAKGDAFCVPNLAKPDEPEPDEPKALG